MRILKMELVEPRCRRGPVARFDVQIDSRIAVRHMVLSISPTGQFRVFPPNLRGANVLWIGPDLASEITAAAEAVFSNFGGQLPNASHHRSRTAS